MKEFRLINTDYNNAAMNMAIDEALLTSEKPVLRFYRWKPAALSLGYFQDISEINIKNCKKNNISIVRRVTGGKTVFHDKELTYSIIIDESLMPSSIVESYKIIANGILLALKELGINVSMKGTNKEIKHKSAICFNEPSYYEIVASNKKIVGSAQTRKNKKLLQHGSVLIDIDINKLVPLFNVKDEKETIKQSIQRITSINNESKKRIDYTQVAEAMKFGFEKNLKIKLEEGTLTKKELDLAENLSKKKYGTKEWNLHRKLFIS